MTMFQRLLAHLLPLVAIATPVSAQTFDHLDYLDQRFEVTADTARALWEYAEVGYQETRSSQLLQEQLAGEGFTVEAGVAEIPTAFVATYGSGEPVLAILGEFDALPGITQDAVPERSPLSDRRAVAARCTWYAPGCSTTWTSRCTGTRLTAIPRRRARRWPIAPPSSVLPGFRRMPPGRPSAAAPRWTAWKP